MSTIFQQFLGRLYDWLNCPDSVCHADLIFALAGRRKRMIFAQELFSQGHAPRMLLSVGPWEINWFTDLPWPISLGVPQGALSIQGAEPHFFVSFDAGKSAVEWVSIESFGTLSEIRALACWLQHRPHLLSALVVSSAPHLRRVRMCCRALLPGRLQLRFLAVPFEGPFLNRDHWWRNSRTRVMVISELPKLLLYRILLAFQTRLQSENQPTA